MWKTQRKLENVRTTEQDGIIARVRKGITPNDVVAVVDLIVAMETFKWKAATLPVGLWELNNCLLNGPTLH
jgi:hypothetical protein